MHQSKGIAAVAVLVAAAGVVGTTPAAAAVSVPLTSLFRNCDFVQPHWVSATGTGSGSVVIGASGADVAATVNIANAARNTRYSVRLIQVPRAGDRTCTVGDPGVAVGELFTDANGTGSAAVAGRRLAGATGAWVSVDGPPPPGQVIGEFYTSEILATLR